MQALGLVVGNAADGVVKASFKTWGSTYTLKCFTKILNYGATSHFETQTCRRPDTAVEAPAIININIQ